MSKLKAEPQTHHRVRVPLHWLDVRSKDAAFAVLKRSGPTVAVAQASNS
jgi:hypothetical protein